MRSKSCSPSIKQSNSVTRYFAGLSRGFTLVELLVVIAIISVLIVLIIPSVREAQDAARMAVCMSNMKQLNITLNSYAVENNGLPPINRSTGWYFTGDKNGPEVYTFTGMHLLAQHMGYTATPVFDRGIDYKVFQCPSDDDLGEFVYSPKPGQTNAGIAGGRFYYSYGTNQYLTYYSGNIAAGDWVRLYEIPRAAQTLLMGEPEERNDPGTTAPYRLYRSAVHHPDTSVPGQTQWEPELRHAGQTIMNTLFYDGHIEPLNADTLVFNTSDSLLPWDRDLDGQ